MASTAKWNRDSIFESGTWKDLLQEIEVVILQLPAIIVQRIHREVTQYMGYRVSAPELRQIVRERSSRIALYERLWVVMVILDEVELSLTLDSLMGEQDMEIQQQQQQLVAQRQLHEPLETESSRSTEPELEQQKTRNSHRDGQPTIEVVQEPGKESRKPEKAGPPHQFVTVPTEQQMLGSTAGPETIGRTDSIRERRGPHTKAALDGETHSAHDRRDKGWHLIRDGVWLELQPP